MNKTQLKFFIVLFFCTASFTLAQDMDYAKKIIKDLSSPEFKGRGYIGKGDSIAAVYLSEEYKKIGLEKYNKSFYQHYTTPINTMPNNPVFYFQEDTLKPGYDYIIIPNSPEFNGNINIKTITPEILTNKWVYHPFKNSSYENQLMMIDSNGLNNQELFTFAQWILKDNYYNAKGIIEVSDHLKFTARTKMKDYIHIMVKPECVPQKVDSVYLKIENQFIEEYKTQNIIGYLPGKSDSIIAFTAHYDHLGFLGETMYPGANDNASGVSMVLNFAKKFAKKKKRKYTYVFILFSGEEAGLLGSQHCAGNPPFDLNKIMYLFNFDMVGTGTEGLFMFNGNEYPSLKNDMQKINEKNSFVTEIFPTNATYGSDHASFYHKGVKSVFFYTRGGNDDYHMPSDTYDCVTFQQYEGLYKLIETYIKER